jgi:hypothetical protein
LSPSGESRQSAGGESSASSAEDRIEASGLRMPCATAELISPTAAKVSDCTRRSRCARIVLSARRTSQKSVAY